MKKTKPLIQHGTFGTHLLENPKGNFSFFGEVPNDARNLSFSDFNSGLHWLADWIRDMEDKTTQRELAINADPKLFALIIDPLTEI